MLSAGGNSRLHLNFWIGGRMRCDLVPDVYNHIRPLRRGVADTTAPLFVEYLTLYEMGSMGEWFNLTNPESFTAKGFYAAQVELLPDPDVQQVDPGTDWPSVWKRRQSGVLSKTSREVLYFLLNDKTMTRVFIKRIYPNSDDTCQRCERTRETISHRYIGCESVSEVWGWVRMSIGQMDPITLLLQDEDLLYLRFVKGLREEDILWLLGVYLEYVENRVILRGAKASVDDFVGHVRYMRYQANYLAMPHLGIIPGTNHIVLNAGGALRNVTPALVT